MANFLSNPSPCYVSAKKNIFSTKPLLIMSNVHFFLQYISLGSSMESFSMTNIEVATIITSIVVREVDLLIEVEIERGGEGYI